MNFSVSTTTSILIAFGTLLSSGIMLAAFLRVIKNIKFKSEIIYGGEAKRRFEDLEKKKILKDDYKIEDFKYEGGRNKIAPRLEFSKCQYNITMDSKFKGCKYKITYYKKTNNEIRVKTWYLK